MHDVLILKTNALFLFCCGPNYVATYMDAPFCLLFYLYAMFSGR